MMAFMNKVKYVKNDINSCSDSASNTHRFVEVTLNSWLDKERGQLKQQEEGSSVSYNSEEEED